MKESNSKPTVLLISLLYHEDLWKYTILLEGNEIPYFIEDENTGTVAPYLSPAIGGIKIFVYDDDYQKASELLRENDLLEDENHNPVKPNAFIQSLANNQKTIFRVVLVLILAVIVFAFLFMRG